MSSNKNIPYYICLLAKQPRLPFIFHNHLSRKVFDLVHCDVQDPYSVTSYSGFKFFFSDSY